MATIQAPPIPNAFIWRRLHSFTGIWIVGFLIIHLLTNSQAALFVGDDASGFIKSANGIRDLPFLQVIEILFLAIPFLVHMVWGVQYLRTGKFNSFPTDGSTPSLPEYPHNHAYTWQRITSWILLVLITLHVIQMRFLEAPVSAQRGTQKSYMVRVNRDIGLYPLSERLGFTLYDGQQIAQEKQKLSPPNPHPLEETAESLIQAQQERQQREWVSALEKVSLNEGQVMAVSKDFGTAELLMVRETFKLPIMLFLYTVLVLSACFHAFNGLWTFLITWGATISPRSQKYSYIMALSLMFLITFLGLAAIWGTYWINLKQ